MVIICLLMLFNLIIGGTSQNQTKVCLTWKIKSGILILRCKTENFDYVVSFFDPADMEQAFCLHQCHSVTDGLTISHNLTTYETFLAIPLGADAEKFNGWWNCRHGTNKDEAKVEITLSTKFSVIGKKDIKYTNKNSCKILTVLLLIVWMTIGFLIPRLVMTLKKADKCLCQYDNKVAIECDKLRQWCISKTNGNFCDNLCHVKAFLRNIVTIIVIVILICTAYLSERENICKDPLSSKPMTMIIPGAIGFLFGVVYSWILQSKCEFRQVHTDT